MQSRVEPLFCESLISVSAENTDFLELTDCLELKSFLGRLCGGSRWGRLASASGGTDTDSALEAAATGGSASLEISIA